MITGDGGATRILAIFSLLISSTDARVTSWKL